MPVTLTNLIDWPRVEALVYGEEASPRDVLAPKILPEGILVQGFFPGADSAEVLHGRKADVMSKEDEKGFFAVLFSGRRIPAYRFRVTYGDKVIEFADPYAFPGPVTETQEKAFLAGTWYDSYKVLGCHTIKVGDTEGACFAVWAPNAKRVSLIGSFNNWNGLATPMHKSPMTGIYELFVPGLSEGESYLYEFLLEGGTLVRHLDPYGRHMKASDEGGLELVSVVPGPEAFDWEDADYLKNREKNAGSAAALSILEMNPGEYESLQEVAKKAIKEGFTHVELTPVFTNLGPEYCPASMFSVSERLGGAGAFKAFVNELHKEGIGVILDWTPAQFPRMKGGLELFDGTPLYEGKTDGSQIHPFWGTVLYNYESPMVKEFLISSALLFFDEFHVDGLRVDDVDAMLYLDYGRGNYEPNLYGGNENLAAVAFLQQLHAQMRKLYPGCFTIAQEDGLWPELTGDSEDCVGFDFKWSGGFTKDLLSYLHTDPILRSGVHDQLSLSMLYSYCERFILCLGRRDITSLLALSSTFPVPEALQMAQLRECLTYLYMHPGRKMIAAQKDLPKELEKFLQDLNALYKAQPALYSLDESFEGFEWIQLTQENENVFAFLRKSGKMEETLLVVANFAAVAHEDYMVGVPFHGKYKEIFSTSQTSFGGEGEGNPRMKTSKAVPCDEREESISIHLGPLELCVFSCTPVEKKTRSKASSSKE